MTKKIKFDAKSKAVSKAEMKKLAEELLKIEKVSLGAKIYNLFVTSKLAYDCDVEDWKNFEAEVVNMIFADCGIDKPEEITDFESFKQTFYYSMVMGSCMSKMLTDPEKRDEILVMAKIISTGELPDQKTTNELIQSATDMAENQEEKPEETN